MYEVFFKFYSCNEDIKPPAAFSCRHIKYKIHAPERTKTRHFYFINSKIPHPPRRLRRLDLRAFGALTHPHSQVWLRAWVNLYSVHALDRQKLDISHRQGNVEHNVFTV